MEKLLHDIIIKNFNNEMIVIQTPEFSGKNILALIKEFMQDNKQGHIDLNDLKNILYIENVLLKKTIIEDMLNSGLILIDESDLDVRYYLNIILPYQLK
jgi:Ca2+-binding EF-hand superfamily protein